MRPLLTFLLLYAAFAVRPPESGLVLIQDSSPNVVIRSPAGGEAVQGAVLVSGSANPAAFQSYELAFGYEGDLTGTWFVIAEGFEPVRNATLAEWDTFAISDGTYTLRLLVRLEDGSAFEDRVPGVRVRNYSAVETSTPTPAPSATWTVTPDLTALFTPSATATGTPTPAPPPTFTPMPPNPASIGEGEIPITVARGALGAAAAFLLLGAYTSLRRLRRK